MTLEASGTQTAVISTEHTLATLATAKTFVCEQDTALMQAGDTIELKAYTTVLTGGVSRVIYRQTYSGVQTDPIKVTIPIVSDIECNFTLKQTAGVGRDFPWKVLSL